MVAAALKWSGCYVWACKNYDGDVSPTSLRRAWLARPDDLGSAVAGRRTVEAEAAHGTLPASTASTRRAEETSTNSIASIFAWTRGLAHRAKLDDNARTRPSSLRHLEKVCVDTVEAGYMTKDPALLIGPDQPWLSPTAFLDKVDENLKDGHGA